MRKNRECDGRPEGVVVGASEHRTSLRARAPRYQNPDRSSEHTISRSWNGPWLRLAYLCQVAIVDAGKQQLCRDGAHKRGKHVPLRVPHVALRAQESVCRMAPSKR